MATHQAPRSRVPWDQDGFLQVKMEDEEASLSQVQECGLGNMVHPEAARLLFRHFHYEEASNPHETLAQLHKLCYQWLQPEVHSKEQMLDLLVLEQFLDMLPPKIQAWVGAQCPKSGKEAAMLVEDLSQDGSQEPSPQRQAASTAIQKRQTWPLRPLWGVFPQDTPLVTPLNPKAAQRNCQDSRGTSGQSLPPEKQIAGTLQSLTRVPPWTSPALNLVPLEAVPVCGQTSPGKRRLLRRNSVRWLVLGQSLHVCTRGGHLPSAENVGKCSRAPGPWRHTGRAIPGRHPTPAVSAGKPSAGAPTWPSTRSCTRGQSPMSVMSVARPSAGSPT
ncbi:zinc finger and SCAN domain-containing protein 22 isoform X2 [Pteronotus mesoamericanus]|uniref:zinc finger and SCAN domain-containing protein 22 isoform X2 n=1 Tax=Pteronotus mesoamericanus TaxID=1884717 RepID=UPI0023EBAC2E|nr:zinc finger and SCAN domain-containing protein 22 isoform X2 [Pteronotus parnellii mesoamericanus]